MNRIEKQFMLDMYTAIHEAVYDKVTDFMRRHPEYWCKTSDGNNKICSMCISFSDMQHGDTCIHKAEPWMSINIGSFDTKIIRLSDISHHIHVDEYTSYGSHVEEVIPCKSMKQ